MTRLTPTNTRWRDRYGRTWAWCLALAVAAHGAFFLFFAGPLSERLYEAMIPAPAVFVHAGAPGSEMEAVELRTPPRKTPEHAPLPAPKEEEKAVEVVPEETASEEITVAEVTAAPSETRGSDEGVEGGTGEAEPAGGGGGGIRPPRPLHLVVPRLPNDVSEKKARGESVHLLVKVLPDGTVGEVRIEKGSRYQALNEAALRAARRMRYAPAERNGVGVVQWTRAEMRF